MGPLTWLDENSLAFPDTELALEDPNGLLAVGGDLSLERLVTAYAQGIFPWFSDGQPILWWSPDPRMTLSPSDLHIGRTLRKLLKKRQFRITCDTAFEEVIQACAETPRNEDAGTWITDEMMDAYTDLHEAGFAHSVEAWQEDTLVGGLYGVSLGKAFFGESMFSRVSGASKVAFATLATQLKQWEFEVIDCQVQTDYLASFGAKDISRAEFEAKLKGTIPNFDSADQLSTFDWIQHWTMPDFGCD